MKLEEFEVNDLITMVRSNGWQVLKKLNEEHIQDYLLMATQRPESLSQDLRTWYSALAAGRKEAFDEAVDKCHIDEPNN